MVTKKVLEANGVTVPSNRAGAKTIVFLGVNSTHPPKARDDQQFKKLRAQHPEAKLRPIWPMSKPAPASVG